MESNQVVISVENLTQRYRVIHERPDTVRELVTRFFRQNADVYNFEAVQNISFKVRKGEMVGIMGRNGSGKSTLLKVISGVYRPSSGSVNVNGSLAPLLELGAGFHPELTGRENIILNGLLMGYSKREMRSREQGITDFAEIGDFIDVPVKQYSSGMYTRLAFAVATEINPDILALDEILAVGDTAFQAKCFARLAKFLDAGKTILLVSHSLNQISSYCSRVLLLDQGQLMFDGAPKEGIERYNLLSGVESSAMVEVGPNVL